MQQGDVHINGSVKHRLPNTTNLMIKGVPAASLISAVPELAFSAGSACSSANPEPSHVLMAMGRSAEEAGCSVRFSLGKNTSDEEVSFAVEKISAAIKKIRSES
jgi:cysteine desulfurase